MTLGRNHKKLFVYGVEILFCCGIYFGSQGICLENLQTCAVIVARYIVYILLIKGTHGVVTLGINIIQTKEDLNLKKLAATSRHNCMLLATATATLVYKQERIFDKDFLFLFVAYLITKYPEIEESMKTINYGTGMACSFFEGYLVHIIPNDGARFVGFEENITTYEAKHNVVFPVRKLFIVITKSLFCPPDLKQFNKPNKRLASIEACESMEDVQKDVAGVKNRTYRNSAYKIHRAGRAPVYLAAECATPLHTLHRVLQRRAIYTELADVDVAEIVIDFCTMLKKVIAKDPECRGKCELVYFDDTDNSQNLADVLLDKIREIEPDFENISAKQGEK